MLVPTVPLVEQQTTMLNTYLRRDYWVTGISGGEYVLEERLPIVLASHVVVFTPQIVV